MKDLLSEAGRGSGPRSRRALPLLLLASTTALGTTSARADDSLATRLSAAGGWTDNVLSAPTEQGPTDPPIESDMFSQLSPGVLFTSETRRMIQVASYTFSANLFVNHTEANSYSNDLAWNSIYSLSAVSELGLSAGASNGRINTFNTLGSASDTGLEQLPNNGVSFVSANVGQFYRRELTRAWRMQQRSALRMFKPIGDNATVGTNLYWNNTAGIQHAWQYDSLGLDMRADYTLFGSTAGVESNKQITVGPSLRYLHDFTDTLSSELSGGTVLVVQADDLGQRIAQPVGTAALRYIRGGGRAEIAYSHSVVPNLFVAQTTANDEVSLRAGLPVPFVSRAAITGSVGYQRGRIVDTQMGDLVGSTKLFLADVAASWSPSEALAVSLRYTRFDQLRSQVVTDTSRSYARNQVLLSLSGRYPTRDAATIPSRLDARVDESNEKSLGETDPSDHTAADADARR